MVKYWGGGTIAILDNLISYYKLDEASGNLVDSKGSNDLTNNSATYGATGIINDALTFDGVSDYLTGSFSKTFTAYTIQAWIKTSSVTNNWGGIISDSGQDMLLRRNINTDKLNFQSVAAGFAIVSTDVFDTDNWIHVVATYDGTTAELWMDGVSQGTDGGTGSVAITTFEIGRNEQINANKWEGEIDEVGVWDRALSDAEVALLFNSGSGKAYPFSTTAQSSTIDFNNGTITTAKLTATFTGGTPTLSMSADGSNFETVTSGVAHVFTNTGTDLRWKAEGEGITITEIKIGDYH